MSVAGHAAAADPAHGSPTWEGDTRDALDAQLSLRGTVGADVCVVGLGAVGLACVNELVARGATVAGVDAGRIGGGASGRNGGFLLGGTSRFHHDDVVAAAERNVGRDVVRAVHCETLAEITRLERSMPGVVRRTGSLRIAASADEEADCERQYAAMRRDALPVELYEGWEGRGLLFPEDAAFQPALRARRLARGALGAGALLFESSRVVNIHPDCVETGEGRVECDAVVVTVDGRLEQLVPELAGRVRTARLQMLGTAPSSVSIARPVYRRWGYDYWQQLPDGRVVLGGCRDVGGAAEWTTDALPSIPVQTALEACLRDVALVRDAPVTHRWAASVGYTVSGDPIAERTRAGVWALGGYSGTGNLMGPLLARAVAARLRPRTGERDTPALWERFFPGLGW